MPRAGSKQLASHSSRPLRFDDVDDVKCEISDDHAVHARTVNHCADVQMSSSLKKYKKKSSYTPLDVTVPLTTATLAMSECSKCRQGKLL